MSSHAAALNGFYRPIRVAYPIRTENHVAVCVRYMKAHWKKISAALACGVFTGFLGGAVSSRVAIPLAVVYAATPSAMSSPTAHASLAASTASQDPAAEVSRLRAQNQELQALVDSLRKQPQHVRTHRAKIRRAHGRAG